MSEQEELPKYLQIPQDMVVAFQDFSWLITKDFVESDMKNIYWLWFRTPSSVQALPFDDEGIRKLIVRATEVLKG